MEKQNILIGAVLIALVAGFMGGYVLRGSQTFGGYYAMQGGAPVGIGMMGDAMYDMMSGLHGRQGDDFDRAFLTGMIVHHQGAVEMAQAALQYAKHDELKQMAQSIIAAQTAEITQMREWQKSWYGGQQ